MLAHLAIMHMAISLFFFIICIHILQATTLLAPTLFFNYTYIYAFMVQIKTVKDENFGEKSKLAKMKQGKKNHYGLRAEIL